jgi:tRNA threonylcarbamoyladenosine biosynthesis protein TsaB
MTMPEKPPLKVLAIDTSSRRGSVALLAGPEVAGELRLASPETHSARLLRSIEFLLQMTGWAAADLNLIAAGIGPGSFTGIRIGVSTALGLAQTLHLPFAGISGLDALAAQARTLHECIGVVVDAQRSQVYFAEYRRFGKLPRSLEKPGLWNPEQLARRLRKRRMYLVGDGVTRVLDPMSVSAGGWPRRIDVDLFLASGVGRLALESRRSWHGGDFLRAEPLYIRPPDALRSRSPKA